MVDLEVLSPNIWIFSKKKRTGGLPKAVELVDIKKKLIKTTNVKRYPKFF